MKEEQEVKAEVFLPAVNEPTFEALHRIENKEENFQHGRNTDVKEEGFHQIQIKSEVLPLECDTVYDDSIKRELLHAELDLKTEILSNHEEQTINKSINNKSFKCNVCTYACARNGSLKRHMQTHTGEKTFKCGLCSFACIQRSNFNLHMKIHTGEKPFKCSVCSYASAQNGDLKRHMHTHTREVSFKCGLCDYGCARKDSLKRHMKTHTGEKSFQCYTCSSKFALKSTLQRHIEVHRKEQLL